jgi:phenylacetate-CoA ligase
MEAAFGCPVVDRYANSENGFLACSLPHDGRLHVNRASYWFEFLRLDSDEPAGTGEQARVVVTDLYARAMPLIRYETGDLAIVGDVVDDEVRTLQAIEGRRADVLRTSAGVMISAATMDTILVPFGGIARYQLVQRGADDFVLRVVHGSERYTAEELTVWLRLLLGSDVRISVEFTADIPDEPNGKYRTLVHLTSTGSSGANAEGRSTGERT